MKVLIVDDEPAARARLRRLLSAHADVQQVLEAGDAPQALALLSQDPGVDLALLDIEMPGGSGLQLAAQLPAGTLHVFTTAYDAHALQAFELGALDYLHKPFSAERLNLCLARVRERLARPAQAAAPPHWWVETRRGRLRILLDELEWLAAADNYVSLHHPPESYLERSTLTQLLAQPSFQALFLRVHRCHAVNPRHVLAWQSLPSGDALLRMRSGTELRASRAYRAALERL
ncbi:DNA-binding LytR/AlgR family response regulator [Inhella inkyongensis]|uniref:DNA-binding LytR/AlgR family response regulator n=1 Tax=Inhella inkyongensis TaxID=392593 RepID=A0A840SAQ5_9BURK|nr:LytTR family DNA-binding domain-containing protein [Inhella inkyongensis]MBB5205874.1 DNA-binding LytR/AlgR family response regulator [Inhella inkyongensis]